MSSAETYTKYDHPIHGQMKLYAVDGTYTRAEAAANASPSIIIYERNDQWIVETPSIAGTFLVVNPGEYVGIANNGRAIKVLPEEIA